MSNGRPLSKRRIITRRRSGFVPSNHVKVTWKRSVAIPTRVHHVKRIRKTQPFFPGFRSFCLPCIFKRARLWKEPSMEKPPREQASSISARAQTARPASGGAPPSVSLVRSDVSEPDAAHFERASFRIHEHGHPHTLYIGAVYKAGLTGALDRSTSTASRYPASQFDEVCRRVATPDIVGTESGRTSRARVSAYAGLDAPPGRCRKHSREDAERSGRLDVCAR